MPAPDGIGHDKELKMVYEDSGIYLLKRWDSAKGVEHYAIGLCGWHAWHVGRSADSIVQLLPSGISIEPWIPGANWNVLQRAQDPEAALGRLEQVRDVRFRLIGFNCEHFARFVISGKRESKQVQGAALLGVAAGLLFLGRR